MNLLRKIEDLAFDVSKNIILPNFGHIQAECKTDGSLLTEIDIQAHTELTKQLIKLADYPVLSEEMSPLEQQTIINNKISNYWCIDPIDGTSNFVHGIPYWCISIALIIEGQIKLGVVYDPNRNECFSASDNSVTTLNRKPLTINQNFQTLELKDCFGMIDFKRLQSAMVKKLVHEPPYRSQRSFGASALDLCWIAAQRCQLYLHGKQQLWDYAAGLLILKQAGGQAETFEGEIIFQNNLQPKSVLAASTEILIDKWKRYIKEI